MPPSAPPFQNTLCKMDVAGEGCLEALREALQGFQTPLTVIKQLFGSNQKSFISNHDMMAASIQVTRLAKAGLRCR